MKIVPRAARRIPLGLPILTRLSAYVLGKRYAGRQLQFVCRAGRQVEEIEITFADGLPLPRQLNGSTIDTWLFSYASHYRCGKNSLTVRREFESHVPGQVCAPEVEAEIDADLKLVRGSMNTRIQFPAKAVAPQASRSTAPATSSNPGNNNAQGSSEHAALAPSSGTAQPKVD